MGSAESKIKSKDEREVPSSPKNVPSTPVQCAKSSNFQSLSELDPRSPSECIVRTPIEIPMSQSNDDANISSSLMHIIDPRSPTDQFHRTPILVQDTASSQVLPKLHNKILDNARRSIMYTPTISSRIHKDFGQVKSLITPPKLLDSSPISKRNNDKRKSFVGLLETNIDYTETDLDNYVKTKFLNSNLTISVNENDLFLGTIMKSENCDPRSPSTDFLRTPIQIVTKIDEIDLNNTNDNLVLDKNEDDVNCNTESLLKIVNLNNSNDEEEDKTEKRAAVEELEEILQEDEICNLEKSDKLETADEEIVSTMNSLELVETHSISNNSVSHEAIVEIIEELLNHVETLTENTELEESALNIETDMKQPIIDLTADVQEFDRKLTKIIYEDKESVPFKKLPKSEVDGQNRNRTPMKDRNLITEPKKNKLRVSDKPRKSGHSDSKIPVFREKKLKVQCENTPPSNGVTDVKKKRKLCQPKWDTDKTLVI